MEHTLKVYVSLPEGGCVDVGELMLNDDKLPRAPVDQTGFTPELVEVVVKELQQVAYGTLLDAQGNHDDDSLTELAERLGKDSYIRKRLMQHDVRVRGAISLLRKPPQSVSLPSHWTPLQIEVLLHYYYSPKNWVEVRGWSQAFNEQWQILYAAGLLEERDDTDRPSGLCLTDKGRAFVARILATSIPEV